MAPGALELFSSCRVPNQLIRLSEIRLQYATKPLSNTSDPHTVDTVVVFQDDGLDGLILFGMLIVI